MFTIVEKYIIRQYPYVIISIANRHFVVLDELYDFSKNIVSMDLKLKK